MMSSQLLLIGFAGGVLLTAACSYIGIRRYVARARLAEQRARAAERMAEIGGMTGGLAHEIKNPLSTIGLNAQLLAEAIDDAVIPEDERSRITSRIRTLRRETERLGGILSDFLQYAGQIHLDRRPADLNIVVEELVDFFLPEAERQGVRVRAELVREAVVAPIDVRQFKQAVLNLMLNATQAMAEKPSTGEIDSDALSPGARSRDLILRTSSSKDPDGRRMARLRVIDTGPGIDEQTRERIFNPYFTTKAGGSGLGLPTSRRLIEEHGGRIELVSQVGVGSEFTVSVPMDVES